LPRRFVVICAAALAIVGGIVFWLLGGGAHHDEKVDLTRVEVALPAPAAAVDPAKGANPSLIERGAFGPLPIIGSDGRKPWQAYARPFDRADTRPRIAIVILNLGLAGADTDAAISKLPPAVTLGFNAYGANLPAFVDKARTAGHELLITVPMEPNDYPREDPGPQTLLVGLSPKQNLDRLEWSLSRATGYVGISNFMGSRYTAAAAELRPTFEVLKGRGLLFFENRVTNQSVVNSVADALALPHIANDREIDAEPSRAGIDQALGDLETIARKKNFAVASGGLYPATIERVAAWSATLEAKGLVLVPLTAVVEEPKEPAKDAKAPTKEAPKEAAKGRAN
jgi:polysaccharide deacetylase 2 family uncharacterized protein YibQ